MAFDVCASMGFTPPASPSMLPAGACPLQAPLLLSNPWPQVRPSFWLKAALKMQQHVAWLVPAVMHVRQ
jgi:hypothetical protein